ncbi:ATP-binding protein [Streptosporangium sp. NPDC001559]|uniref:ATP-binding protein n=1 Tax=Streptosporangium sp. NPDC001559 TaxID=3366187 RepID=UPI0036F09429
MRPEKNSETSFPDHPESASRARDEVREWLGADHPAYENVRLAVSELVTDAVRHAGGEPGDGSLTLGLLALGDLLRVEVVDQDGGTTPLMAWPESSLLSESGRGLVLVGLLSGGSWGCRSLERGRTVWCEIPAIPRDPFPGPEGFFDPPETLDLPEADGPAFPV